MVILFDEMYIFVLDGNSKLHLIQTEVIQFITPSLSTYFYHLSDVCRDKHNDTIFFLTANYFERLDSAITMHGRIDKHIHVIPPNQYEREKTIQKSNVLISKTNIIIDTSLLKKLVNWTVLYSVAELNKFVG